MKKHILTLAILLAGFVATAGSLADTVNGDTPVKLAPLIAGNAPVSLLADNVAIFALPTIPSTIFEEVTEPILGSILDAEPVRATTRTPASGAVVNVKAFPVTQ